MSRILVAGAGGFLGGHLVRRLLADGHEVTCVDVKSYAEWHQREEGWWCATLDLREYRPLKGFDTVVNLAADMGGMGFIDTHRADCMTNVLINTNLLRAAVESDVERFLFASSACVYNTDFQTYRHNGGLKERYAYPARPDSDYGWEKLYSERVTQAFANDYGLDVRIPRIHNCYGPHGTWTGGREKAPAAICRKVAEAVRDGTGRIEIWGDGEQTRSFMWVDDCIEGIVRLLDSDMGEPVNLGSAELVSINELVTLVERCAGVTLERRYGPGPQGVRGRCSDNTLIRERLGWEPPTPLAEGIARTYEWVAAQVAGAGEHC